MEPKRCVSLIGGKILAFAILVLLSEFSWASDIPRRTLELKVGGSELMDMVHPVKRVSIAAPAIADVVILSPKQLYVYGKKVGYTSVIMWEEGRGSTLLDVVVSLDLTSLKEKIHELFPEQEIEVHASETGIVLSGTVSGPEVAEQVLRLTRTYLPQLSEGAKENQKGTGRSDSRITNLLNVGGIQQVMLEVKFAEVTRTWNKEWQAALGLVDGLGSDFTGALGTSILGVNQNAKLSQDPGSLLLNFAGNPANIFINVENFTAALNLLEREGLARTLAEPRLVTQSGQEASFLAGGEFPIPVAQEYNKITLEYKEFGVALKFTPVVLSNGRISLRVAPIVSEIASESTIPSGLVGVNFIYPNLSTRKLETSVQLYDGQTLALAGLLQDQLREEVKKVPGLGDIPILGALFRSSEYTQAKTDLLVAVTPHLVKPGKEGSLKFPGESMRAPTQYEFYLEGKLEGQRPGGDGSALSTHDFSHIPSPGHKKGGLEGDFGHQPPM